MVVNLANEMDKFVVKTPKISTDPTPSPVRTLPCQRLRTVAIGLQILGRKKVGLFKLAGKDNRHE